MIDLIKTATSTPDLSNIVTDSIIIAICAIGKVLIGALKNSWIYIYTTWTKVTGIHILLIIQKCT